MPKDSHPDFTIKLTRTPFELFENDNSASSMLSDIHHIFLYCFSSISHHKIYYINKAFILY